MSYHAVIQVIVVEAKDLVAADKTGTSDPYITMSFGKQKQNTKMIERTLTPVWNETFNFYVPESGGKIKFEMFDYDQYSSDDSLGNFVLNVKDLEENKNYDEWIKLSNTDSGEVHLQYTYRVLQPDEEITLVYAEDDDDPELRVRLRGESYWPLKGSVFSPTNWKQPKNLFNNPPAKLDLQFVYGYRGWEYRENLHYTSQGHLAYHCAAVGVVYSTAHQAQKFFTQHNDDIVSMAIHPNGEIVATGQVASLQNRSPKVCVWNTTNMELLAELEGFHERSVCSLGFSPDGSLLVSVGTDDKNSVCVYDWKSKKTVAHAYGHSQKIFLSKFVPSDNNSFVTAGVKHIKFWKIEGNKLTARDGIFKRFPIQSFFSLAFTSSNDAVAGAYSGDIYIWSGNEASRVITEAHNGPVYAMINTPIGIVSSGKDGKLNIWKSDPQEKPEKTIDLTANPNITQWEGTVVPRALAYKEGTIAIGTRTSEIYEVNVETGDAQLLTSGHFEEFWGLATHPEKPIFLTTGKDKAVRLFSAEDKKPIKVISIDQEGICAHFSHDGKNVAVGLENGNVLILDSETLDKVQELNVSKSKVDDVKYSSDGRLLAASCHDSTIHIFFFDQGGWKEIGVCKGHASCVLHIDWSTDSKVLQSDSGSYEHLFWDIEDVQQITKTVAVRDISFATWTCVLGWHVKAIWPKGADGTDINAACRSHNGKVVVTSDDFGEVKLFRFPCVEPNQKFRAYGGHSSHVTNVRFGANDAFLISAGGNDRAIFQWRVTHLPDPDEEEKVEEAPVSKKAPPSGGKAVTTTATKATKSAPSTPSKTPVKNGKATASKTATPEKVATPKKEPAGKPTATKGTATPTKLGSSGNLLESARIDKLEKRVDELEQLVKSLLKKD